MKSTKDIFNNTIFIRIFTLVVLIVVIYSLRELLNLVLLTFIFIVLMGKLQSIISGWVNKVIPKKYVVIFLYMLIISLLTLLLYKYLPIIADQITELVVRLISFYKSPPDNIVIKYTFDYLNKYVSPSEFDTNLKFLYQFLSEYISNIGKIALQVFIALLLSLFFLLGKDHIAMFTSNFKTSFLGRFFIEVEFYGKRFVNSFGKVIEVQFLIAFINAVLTTLVLWMLGFPQLLGLGIMIFFLGLIPVAGVIVSLIPLSIIAYSIGGGIKIVYVLILILCIHALESYVLNPKLMSIKTHMPVFYTFTVLLIAEHFFGIWGLILGIPIFIFFLDIIGVEYTLDKYQEH